VYGHDGRQRRGSKPRAAGAAALALLGLLAACDGSDQPTRSAAKPAVTMNTSAAQGETPLLGLFGSGDDAPALVDSDRSQVRAAEARAYRAAEGKPVHWQNPRSGAFGEIVPLGGVRRQGDQVCQDFRHMVMVAGAQFEGRVRPAASDDGRRATG
jgi:surface antigen